VRLVKFLAHAGVASRRESEKIIFQGLVKINGKPVKDPAFSVTEQDEILVKNKKITKEILVYFLFHKPAGVTTTLKDVHAEKTLRPFLRKIRARIVPVGRLDKNSTGLLFLTNDGELTHRLTHPRYEIIKTYEVCVTGKFVEEECQKLLKGISSEGDLLKVKAALILKEYPDKTMLQLELGEGKKREIRRMMEVLGRKTISLKRVQMGPVKLGDLISGEMRELNQKEIKDLKNSAGLL